MINHFYIHNFRCLENFTLDLKGRQSILLIGKNGSGKSSIRKAMEIVQKICRGSHRPKDVISKSDYSKNRNDSQMKFEMDAFANDFVFRYSITLDYPDNFREPRVVQENLKIDEKEIFNREFAKIDINIGSQFNLDWNVPAISVIGGNQFEKKIESIRKYFNEMIFVQPNPYLMTGLYDEESDYLNSNASNFANWFRNITIELSGHLQQNNS